MIYLCAFRALACVAAIWFGCAASVAANLVAVVKDDNGNALDDAVVTATNAKGTPAGTPTRENIDQVNREFVPYVKAVYAGSTVSFPNKDSIQHHVYSFSPAKKFDLPLYEGKAAGAVVFDKPGLVTLGCNIHDWMIAHVYVAETPYFGVTASSGRSTLRGLPPGDYVVRVWHPRMNATEESSTQRITVDSQRDAEVSWQLKLKPEMRMRRAPTLGNRGYR